MGFAVEITPEEAALGFRHASHPVHGSIVTASLGNGIQAVKVTEPDSVLYVICDDRFVVLYPAARSLPELRRRFDVGDRKTA